MQVSKQMFFISGWINRPRVKDWPDMWCFPGQGCGSNVSMARSQDQSPLVPVLSSLTPPSAPLLSLLHSQNWPRRRIVLRSPSHALIPSLMSSVVMMMVVMDSPVPMWLPLVIWYRPGPGADSFIKCWRAGGVLRPGPHVTTRGEQQTAGRHPSPRPRPASQKMNEILILSSLCKLLYSTTFPNFLKLLRFHSKHSILKILNTRSTGATAPPEDTCISTSNIFRG